MKGIFAYNFTIGSNDVAKVKSPHVAGMMGCRKLQADQRLEERHHGAVAAAPCAGAFDKLIRFASNWYAPTVPAGNWRHSPSPR